MSWSGRLLPGIAGASIGVCILGLALGPELVYRKWDESSVAIWRMVGDSIIQRDIASLSRQLDEERDLVSRMRMRRDALATRLRDLEQRSSQHGIAGPRQVRRGPSMFVTGGPWDAGDRERESDRRPQRRFEDDGPAAWADDALASIATEIERVDHQIETVEGALRARARDLFVLEAATEARRIRQELAGSGGPLSWNARLGRLSGFLRPIGVAPDPD